MRLVEIEGAAAESGSRSNGDSDLENDSNGFHSNLVINGSRNCSILMVANDIVLPPHIAYVPSKMAIVAQRDPSCGWCDVSSQ
jgi:hypothetical protein